MALSAGRLEALCEFEEFGANTPLNRVLLAGARIVSASSALPWPERRRALSIAARMDEVGPLRPADERARLDRRTAYYGNAHSLARHIIAGQGRTIGSGTHYARTFLIRTPEMVEEGLRRILQRRLAHRWRIEKRGRQLAGSTMTVNPDIVVKDGIAVADVKYKLTSKDWARGDLYEVVTFAVEYRSQAAALIGFNRTEGKDVSRVQVGDIHINAISWPAFDQFSPQQSEQDLVNAFERWLDMALCSERSPLPTRRTASAVNSGG